MGEDDAGGPGPRRRPRVGSTGARFPRVADDEPAVPAGALDAVIPEQAAAQPGEVGLTGARFGSRARRRRREQSGALPAAEGPAGLDIPESGETGRTGARFNSRARRRRRAAEELAAAGEGLMLPFQQLAAREPEPDDAPTLPFFLDRAPAPESTRTTVRPYVRTRGRTRSRIELRIETLVSLPSPRPSFDDPEQDAIGALCDGPRSVAEVAALLSVPLGVARVLIDDMAADGKLTVHPTVAAAPSRLDVMARVLDGLHRL